MRRARRALHRRRQPGARLPRPPGADGGALRARPVRAGGAAPACTAPATSARRLPDGAPRVPRPPRPSGQGPRLPHRARGDRGRPGAAPRRARRRGAGCDGRGRCRGAAPAGLRGPPGRRPGAGAHRRGPARAPARARPRVHGARRLRAGGRAAAHAHGKLDRRALLALAPAAGAATAGRAAPRGPVEELLAGIWCEVLGPPEVGVARQLLRARRALAARHSGGGPHPPGVRRRAAPAPAVRGAHARRPGARGRGGEGGDARRARPAPACRPRAAACCRCPSPRSASGSSTSSTPARRPTTCPACYGWRAFSIRERWRRAWPRSCAGTRPCAPPSPSPGGGRCR